MIIDYKVGKYIYENQKIEIEDQRNVFLKGTNPYDGLSTYFGIWENENGLAIVTIISSRNISYEYSRDRAIHTESNIKDYLERNLNVKVISKQEFKQKLDSIQKIIEI